VFSYATIRGKHCKHLCIIALPLAMSVGLITTIVSTSSRRAFITMAASILRELGLDLC